MKNFTTFLKTLVLFAAFISAKTSTAQINQCSVSITYTVNANGNVGFTPVTSQTLGTNTWAWGNGAYSYSIGNTPAYYTYTANGIYTVTLICGNAAFTCTSIVTQTISVNTVTNVACNVIAGFTSSSPSPGTYNFISTSTGTTGTSGYSWNYGDGGTGTGSSGSHTYSSDGTYLVILLVTDATPASCSDSSFTYVTVCTATNDFTWSNSANGAVAFTSSAPTTTASSFYWTFGDGGYLSGGAGSAAAPTHTYATNGSYVVTMLYSGAMGCSVTAQHTITVSNVINPCVLNANFSYTATGNVINFMNTTNGTGGGVTYTWNFGDGNTSTATSPSHTYAAPGNYNVTLFANNNFSYTCVDSVFVTVATQSCIANAGFTLASTGTPQYWNAYPAAPGNIAGATWSWGDGSTSNTLYTSHTYSAAGFYTICLTVTTTCGATGTSCWVYNIYRPANGSGSEGVVYVNVVDASAVGIKNNTANTVAFAVSPNPNNGTFHVNLTGITTTNTSIKVYNLVGQEVYAAQAETLNGGVTKDIQLDNIANGVYFIKINVDGQTLSKKIIISKN